VVERGVILTQGEVLGVEDLPDNMTVNPTPVKS
jgi:hypothetical protein